MKSVAQSRAQDTRCDGFPAFLLIHFLRFFLEQEGLSQGQSSQVPAPGTVLIQIKTPLDA